MIRAWCGVSFLCLLFTLFIALPLGADPDSHNQPVKSARKNAPAKSPLCEDYRTRFANAASSSAPAKVNDDKSKPPGHSVHGPAFDEGPRGKAVPDPKMGKVHFDSSCNAEAQKFLDQGLAQFHGFLWYESERSFRQALAVDASCPIAIWGMAIAAGGDIWTPTTSARSAQLARRAVELRDQLKREGRTVSETENGWLDAYAAVTADNSPAARRKYLKTLREIAAKEGTEAKAVFVFALLKNDDLFKPQGASFLEKPSQAYLEETDGLIEKILKAEPEHPAHHYKIHLWDYVDTERSLDSAERSGPSAPGIAHMWHMPGHVYFKLRRYAEALWHQEASARVDHDYLAKSGLMPFLNPTYVHNNGWLAETMLRVGRGRDAVRIARSLPELPRHPAYQGGETNAARAGWDRLLDALEANEDWTQIEEVAKAIPYRAATAIEELKWQRLRAVSAYHRRDEKALEQASLLVSCLTEFSPREKTGRVQLEISALTALLAGDKTRALKVLGDLRKVVPEPVHYYEQRPGLTKSTLAGYFGNAGDFETARELSSQAVAESPQEVMPLAQHIAILASSGKAEEAKLLYQQLGKLARFADRDLPVFERLAKSLGEMPRVVAGLEWKEPRRHPALETMGPLLWSPPPATDFELPDADGKKHKLSDYDGKPRLVVFNLGGACVHCNAQLAALSKLGPAWRERGFQTIVVTPDTVDKLPETRKRFAAEGLPADTVLLSDPKAEAFRKAGIYDDFEGQPLHGLWLVGRDGKVLWRDGGSEPFLAFQDFLLGEADRLLRLEAAKARGNQVPPK